MPDPLQLVFVDPKGPARIRKQTPWRALLDDARRAVPEPEPFDPVLPGQSLPAEDRADVFLVLARGAALEEPAVAEALASGVRADGKLALPLVLVAGELRFAFDELEELKAMVTTATPFLGGDEPLEAAVSAGKAFLEMPDLRSTPAVTEGLTTRVRQAFGRVKRAVPAGHLEAQTDRALLEQRRYQQRTFCGEPHLRALLHAGEGRSMLAYLPSSTAMLLPLLQHFPARLIAEALPSTDQYETHPFALRVLALARLVTPVTARGARPA
jgi:hypothetical protein